MPNVILLVFEGEKTEVKIYQNIHKHFFAKYPNTVLYATYRTDIYNLYQEIEKDPYLDIFELLKEKNKDKVFLQKIERDNISQIFLFFDYDGHIPNASDDKIEEMLNIFNEETDQGRLYISYPMVEALKDFKKDCSCCFNNCKMEIDYFKSYKKIVSERTSYRDTNTITDKEWDIIFKHHLKKMNCLLNSNYDIPKVEDIQNNSPIDIFNLQKKYFIKNRQVMILSGFPFFIMEYFGYDKYI